MRMKCSSLFLLLLLPAVFISGPEFHKEAIGLNMPIYSSRDLEKTCMEELDEKSGILHFSPSGKLLDCITFPNRMLPNKLFYSQDKFWGVYDIEFDGTTSGYTSDGFKPYLYSYSLKASKYIDKPQDKAIVLFFKPLKNRELPLFMRYFPENDAIFLYDFVLISEDTFEKTYQFEEDGNFDIYPNGITYNPHTSEYIMTPGRYKDAFQAYLDSDDYAKPGLNSLGMQIGGPIYPLELAFYDENKNFVRSVAVPGVYNTTLTGLAGATSQFYCKLECLSENELLLERRFTKTHEYFPEEKPESCTYINLKTGASKKLPFEYIAYLDAEKRLAITVDRYDGKNPKLYQILDDGETKLLSDFTATEKKLILNQPIGESISLLAPADMQWEQYFIIDKIGSRLENVYFKQDFKIDSTNYTMILRYNMEKQAFVPILCIEKYKRCFVADDGSLYFETGKYAY